jgi:cytosine deaminase
MSDSMLSIQNARLLNGQLVDLIIKNGLIDQISMHTNRLDLDRSSQKTTNQIPTINAEGCLLSTAFVDAHFHLDAVLSLGSPRFNQSGTLLEGIQIWAEQKPDLVSEQLFNRIEKYLHWAIAKGTLAIRSHVDICDPSLLAVRVLKEIQSKFKPYIDIQLVAFPQDGYLRHPKAIQLLDEALNLGVEVVGGIPHFERSQQAGRESIEKLLAIAAKRNLLVDMHCDENDDPQSKQIEVLAEQTVKYGLQGRVSASHVTSMHSMDNDYVYKLLSLLAEAQMQVIANPLINITLQGRQDTYPKRRGMTRVAELMKRGINVAFGHDCVMDPWYALGSGDLLEVASMGLHVGQLTSLNQMRQCFDAVTINPSRILGLDWSVEVGKPANLVILNARDPIEAIRLRAERLFVIRNGEIIARRPKISTSTSLFGQNQDVNWMDVVSYPSEGKD